MMVRKFKSKAAFKRYAAHIHIHDIPHKPGQEVEIAGRRYKPEVAESEKHCSKIGYCKSHRVVHY